MCYFVPYWTTAVQNYILLYPPPACCGVNYPVFVAEMYTGYGNHSGVQLVQIGLVDCRGPVMLKLDDQSWQVHPKEDSFPIRRYNNYVIDRDKVSGMGHDVVLHGEVSKELPNGQPIYQMSYQFVYVVDSNRN